MNTSFIDLAANVLITLAVGVAITLAAQMGIQELLCTLVSGSLMIGLSI